MILCGYRNITSETDRSLGYLCRNLTFYSVNIKVLYDKNDHFSSQINKTTSAARYVYNANHNVSSSLDMIPDLN